MHTRTHLKAALHQLSLAKAEMRSQGNHGFAENIADAELTVVNLIREFYAIDMPKHRETV